VREGRARNTGMCRDGPPPGYYQPPRDRRPEVPELAEDTDWKLSLIHISEPTRPY